jgi:hypothetical protein
MGPNACQHTYCISRPDIPVPGIRSRSQDEGIVLNADRSVVDLGAC